MENKEETKIPENKENKNTRNEENTGLTEVRRARDKGERERERERERENDVSHGEEKTHKQ